MENKLLINFDCVGNGENILFIESEKAKESPLYKKIKENVKENENYSLSFFDAKSSECNSDHKNFPCSVAVVACKKYHNMCNVRAYGEILMAEMEETGADWLNYAIYVLTGFNSEQLAKECRANANWAQFYRELYYVNF